MIYHVEVVNPKTNEQRILTVELSTEQAAAVKSSACEMSFVQDIARPAIPDGFMPIGNRVWPATLN